MLSHASAAIARDGPIEFSISRPACCAAVSTRCCCVVWSRFLLVHGRGRACLARYDFLDDDHGFMVGVDYVDAQHRHLPLQWVSVARVLSSQRCSC